MQRKRIIIKNDQKLPLRINQSNNTQQASDGNYGGRTGVTQQLNAAEAAGNLLQCTAMHAGPVITHMHLQKEA